MDYILHENVWWWGKSYNFITIDGKATIELSIENERPDAGCVQSLMVHESVRRKGIGNALLFIVEEYAKKIGLEQIYLDARKGTFLINWYRKHGFEIYDEKPEYSKGQTISMNKYI